MTMRKGYTYMAMQMIIGIVGLLGGFVLGDVACGLLGFFDNYNTSIEATGNGNDEADRKGRSLTEDYFSHFFIIHATTIVAGVIAFGGFDFALMGLGNKMSDLLP